MKPTPSRLAAKRQEFESVRDTLDTLALNLTNYGHTWSPELRTAYENAIAFLSRAASEPKATVKTKPGETTVTVDFRGGAA